VVGVIRMLRALGVVLLAVAVPLLAGPAAPAQAAPGESISRYDVRIEVRVDGQLFVEETIGYDFGRADRHGIVRRIPVRFRYDDTHDRIYPLDHVGVTMDGAPVRVDRSGADNQEVLKIGDPDRTVTGSHTYRISYAVRGVVNRFGDHDELYWNAIGTEWDVPIGTASATVTGPGPVQRTTCFTGPAGGTARCAGTTSDGSTATFQQSGMSRGHGLTVVVGYPPGSVEHADPILTTRHTVATAFRVTPLTAGTGLALALLGAGAALAIAWRTGRDRYYVGQLPGLVPDRDDGAEQRRKPLFGAPPVSVEFVPPEGIRPGQVGTLVDEHADVIDVSATIVDFAVRRHLHIRELRPPRGKADWELTKLTDGDPKFLRYERTLFRELFAEGDTVRLSELRNTFAADLAKVRDQLYADVVSQGWYKRSPARTRLIAKGWAVAGLFFAVAVTVVLAVLTQAALIGVGLVLAAIVLVVAAGRFPARTGRGSAALARVQGFRLYIATAEAEQLRFQEREQIFSTYLPYAIVFRLADRWARIFRDLAAARPDGGRGLYWYTGPADWSMLYFATSIGDFTTTTGTTLSSTPPSASGSSGFSGGGFSGGGAGGGGGGSW